MLIFICLNKKTKGNYCAKHNAEEIFTYFKEALLLKKSLLDEKQKFKVVKTSCLGRCSLGPNIFISPDNIWYRYNSKQDIDEIIDVHLIQNKIVERLRLENP